MAGIGEASAIIAVAQAGISLSMVIIAYVSDVRDAPKSVSRIGNEIKSTSGRLQEIAGIIEDNPSTGLLLDTAIGDATRCSSECELILAQVGNLLVKGGWRRDSTELSKSDIDASVVASLKWPFLKTRLETPRVELQRIKADLILLFNVAMARKSSTPLTNEYARKIPLLTRKKEEAARRAEEAKQRARDSQGGDHGASTRSPRASGRPDPQLAEEDPELYQQFYEFELQRAKEQEDRRIEERATLLQAEKDNKRKAEEAAQQEIAQRAVQDYKLRQEELNVKTIAQERQLGDELLALGLSPEQIASILAVPSLNANDIRGDAVVRRKSADSQQTSLTKSARRPSKRGRSNFPIKLIPWKGTRNSQSHDSENISVESSSQGNRSSQYNRGIDDQVNTELWLVDVFSRQHLEVDTSNRWLIQKLKRIEKSHDVWHRFAQLQPMWRVAIQDFLKDRNKAQSPEHPWRLIHIGLPRRMTKMAIFGHQHGGQLVRLIVSQRKIANQAFNSVVVVSGENDKTSPSTVNASTYLPRQLVSISAIRESSYDYNEMFELPSDDAPPELRDVTSKSHVMIPEALTLKQVNQLASLTKSFMESGRVPWRAQPLFTYIVTENQVPDSDTGYDEKTYGRERADRVVAHQPRESIEKLVNEAEKHLDELRLERAHGPELKTVDLMRPTYIKVNRKHMSPETLDAYGLPWEWDERDSQYIIIKRWIKEADQEILFEHTKKLLERKSLVDIIPRVKDDDEKTRLERSKRGRSPERGDIRPESVVLRERSRDRFSYHEHPSRKSAYDDGIRVQGYDRSPFPSPTFNPQRRPYAKDNLLLSRVPPPLDSGIKPQHDYEKPKFHVMVESGDDDDYDDLPPPADDENDEDADLIAKTLSRYTTFKIDEDVTAGAKSSPTPEPEVSGSPTISESRYTSPLRYSKTLEQMKSSLEKMQTKKSRAEEDGDEATASDLRYYAIPDMEQRIKEEEEALRKRVEAKAAKFEHAGRTYGVQSRRNPMHSVIASPTTVKGGVASAQNVSKKTQKATPSSRVQRQGDLEDSATEEQDNRSGSQTSHLLKKMKSTADLRNDDSAAASLQSSRSSNHVTDHANQNIGKKNPKQDNRPTEPLQNGARNSTDYVIRRRHSRSPSQSESEREPVRRADTRLYEADFEGSGGEARVLERRDTWRRPTVEDEDYLYIEVEEEH